MNDKINAINFIIETIDRELEKLPNLYRQIYLTERKEKNVKKLAKINYDNKRNRN